MEEDLVDKQYILPLFTEYFEMNPQQRAAYPVDYLDLLGQQKLINVIQLSNDRRITSIQVDEEILQELENLVFDIKGYLDLAKE